MASLKKICSCELLGTNFLKMGECMLIFIVKFKMLVFGLSASNRSHVLKITWVCSFCPCTLHWQVKYFEGNCRRNPNFRLKDCNRSNNCFFPANLHVLAILFSKYFLLYAVQFFSMHCEAKKYALIILCTSGI